MTKHATIIKSEDIKDYTKAQLLEIINTQSGALESKQHQINNQTKRIIAEPFMREFGANLIFHLRQIPFSDWPEWCKEVYKHTGEVNAVTQVSKDAFRDTVFKP